MTRWPTLYDRIVDSALKHGQQEDPDHEVGDLQDVIYRMIQLLTPEQLAELEAMLPDILTEYDALDGDKSGPRHQ